jgi:hypothetical protein
VDDTQAVFLPFNRSGVSMSQLHSAARGMIDTGEPWTPIDVYAVAEVLHASFPDRDLSELAKIVSEVAVRKPGRSLLWERLER